MDRVGDRGLVFDVFLERVGVVEAQMTGTAVLGGEPEVEDDRLRVAVVQVPVGLGRKARDDAPAILPARVVLRDDRAKKIGGGLRMPPARGRG